MFTGRTGTKIQKSRYPCGSMNKLVVGVLTAVAVAIDYFG
jgi:hypothetical protein